MAEDQKKEELSWSRVVEACEPVWNGGRVNCTRKEWETGLIECRLYQIKGAAYEHHSWGTVNHAQSEIDRLREMSWDKRIQW